MESGSSSSQLHHEHPLTLAGKLKKLYLGRVASKFKKSKSAPPRLHRLHREDTLPPTPTIFAEALYTEYLDIESSPPQSHSADTSPTIMTVEDGESPLSQSHHADTPRLVSAEELNQVFLFFWHAYSPVMYTLYKIDVPRRLPRPPTKAAQELEIRNPSPLFPILELETGKHPENICCVQLSSKLYFLGGELNINNPYIDENLRMELKSVQRDVFPREVYSFDLAYDNMYSRSLSEGKDSLLLPEKPMNSGKASPLAFVAEEKIYVVGSSIETNISDRSELKHYFEVYDPVAVKWKVLPDPPIRNVNTRWVGHAVVGRNALLVAWQQGKERIHCFDLDTHQWTKYVSLPSYPGNFSGRTEFVEDTLYGCYHSTVAAIAPLAEEEEEAQEEEETDPFTEEEEEAQEEEETKEKGEIEELQQAKSLFKHARLLRHHRLHLVSEEMGMDAILNVPPQLQSSSSLLHLGSRYFCYVRTGMPPHPIHGDDHAILDDKRRFISIVIFLALRETYKQDSTRLFRAKFLHSAHYVVDTPFPSEGFIDGCFSPGLCCSYTRMKQGEALSTLMPLFSIEFSFSELKEATLNFDSSMMIGEERCYDVYKGVLRDIQTAIKIFHPYQVGLSEYQQELDVLSKLRHPNIVAPIGVCPEVHAIIYEYLPNGSLEDQLSCKDKSPPLSSKIRIRIAAEMCSVLIFLHSCKPNRIIHGDLKPSNILLDAYFVSKLADFGTSHVFSHDESSNDSELCRTTKTLFGTFGYIDPEYVRTSEITTKSDVFSFGIVLLRLLTGIPIGDIADLRVGNLEIPLDPLAGDWPVVQAEQLADLALRCCKIDQNSRPDLVSVWRVLEPMRDSCEGSASFLVGF